MTVRDILLGSSRGFEVFKRAIASDRAMGVFASEYIEPQPGERILDVGCGLGDMVPYLGDVDYVGVELNASYVETARRRYPSATFVNASVEDLPNLGIGDFDCALVVSVLHHLDDDQVTGLVSSLPGVMKPAARLVTVDPAWLPTQRTTARVLIAMDRGRHVRDLAGYERLLAAGFEELEFVIREDLLRTPYTYCISRSTVRPR